MSQSPNEEEPLEATFAPQSPDNKLRRRDFITGGAAGGGVVGVSASTFYVVSALMRGHGQRENLYEYLSAQRIRLANERNDVLDDRARYSEGGREPNPAALKGAEKRMGLLELLITEFNQRLDLLEKDEDRPPLQPLASVYEVGDRMQFGTFEGKPMEMDVVTPPGAKVEFIPK